VARDAIRTARINRIDDEVIDGEVDENYPVDFGLSLFNFFELAH
jgi:hypothetical protein